jgi:hypothetical protein
MCARKMETRIKTTKYLDKLAPEATWVDDYIHSIA